VRQPEHCDHGVGVPQRFDLGLRVLGLWFIRLVQVDSRWRHGRNKGCHEGEDCLRLQSHMPENGVVFSDGIEGDYLSFNSGTVLTVGVAAEYGQLVVH
jgi:hypothetical protein